MATTRIMLNQDSIVSEIEIAAPPERVFKALTDAGELNLWFTNPECPAKFWEMDPRIGGAYGYTTQAGSIVVNGVREFECHGGITEYDSPRVVVHTWYANWHDDPHPGRNARESYAQRFA